MSNSGPPNSEAHFYYSCAPVPSPRSREETAEGLRVDKYLKVERREREKWEHVNPWAILISPVRSQKGADGGRGRIESLSQKSKLESVSTQTSRWVLKSIQNVLCGEDVLISVNSGRILGQSHPSVCSPQAAWKTYKRESVRMRALGGARPEQPNQRGLCRKHEQTLQGTTTKNLISKLRIILLNMSSSQKQQQHRRHSKKKRNYVSQRGKSNQ